LEDEIGKEVDSIIRGTWKLRDGQVIPETQDLTLDNSGVKIQATILYADLADSTELALYSQEIAAEVCKSYLLGTTRLIRACDGQIRSFDGDRVMGVFVGNHKNTNAAKAALKINYFFTYILQPQFLSFYQNLGSSSFKFAHCTGVDTGEIRVVRAGIRNNNDLIWVGRAPNIAAKLSSIRDPGFSSYITSDVFARLNNSAKFFNGTAMWEARSWAKGTPYGTNSVYRSSWWLKPSYTG
jgi:class 3 adenylate cyclase